MRLAATILLTLLLSASALDLAPGPAVIAPAHTPACPQLSYPDAAALLGALPRAGYACAEELAAALRPRADRATLDALLALALGGPDARARRNGLRAIGRLAEGPRGSRPHELVLRGGGAAVRQALAAILADDRDNFLLQDAIWLLDSFFFPSFSSAPLLEGVAADPAHAPALRYRAAAARARLIYPRPGLLTGADLAFIRGGLRSDAAGVRAAAATAVARLRNAQLTAGLRADLAAELAAALALEAPLALPAAAADPRGTAWLSFSESAPASLTVRAGIARARDRLAGGSDHLAELRSTYAGLALPNQLARGPFTLRAGLPAAALPGLLDEAERLHATFFSLVGPELTTPIAGEDEPALTMLIFASQAIYRDYMRAFTPFSVEVDGVYDERSATLYTYQRTPEQSENSLVESLRHELTHHLAARHLFPGRWDAPGYHAEPKGWADEGLAELLAGEAGSSAEMAGWDAWSGVPRPRQLARLCARAAPPVLSDTLARREGYDRFGRFDYDGAWALSYHLLRARPAAARRLYAAYRDGSYRLADWARIAGVDSASFANEWHAAIRGWCG